MNMFTKSKATTVGGYIAAVPEERRELVQILHEFIQKSAPTLRSYFASNMLGYGSFPYLNHKKEKITWPIIALANQKNYVSIYVCSVEDGVYLAEKYASELGRVSVGKSCIRFKKLEDVNLPMLAKVLKLAAKAPGLAVVGAH